MKYKIVYKSRWQKWFAWHPVQIGEYIYWLQYVGRAPLNDGTYEYKESI